jgi:hypothetical protein
LAVARPAWGRAVPTLCALAVAFGGCGKKAPESPDAAVLAALAPYDPKPTLNDQGRVVELKLDGSRVDDGALAHVKSLPELKVLSLYGTSITDGGLASLKDASKIEALGLGKTGVTRRGLSHLERLPALRWLWLTENKSLTAEEVEDFKKKAVPGITVYR